MKRLLSIILVLNIHSVLCAMQKVFRQQTEDCETYEMTNDGYAIRVKWFFGKNEYAGTITKSRKVSIVQPREFFESLKKKYNEQEKNNTKTENKSSNDEVI